jgi:hypothetical protein
MVSYAGRNAEITLCNLIASTYPNAKTLADLVTVTRSHDGNKGYMHAQTQTTDRIFTFPIPMPTPITAECVSMGEPEIKESQTTSGELWHARLGHISDDLIKLTSKAYPEYKIPQKY